MVVIAVAGMAAGQTPAQKPKFEVASIRLSFNQSVGRPGFLYALPSGHLKANGILMSVLIFDAYNLKGDFELIGGQDWMTTMRWDLDAQAEGNPSYEQMMLMLRSLLEDKVGLKVHREKLRDPADGLKLESSKGPVEVLVIDSVSRPTEN
jgi:uncharacterized protein (TIGR03435 family)